MKSIILVMFVTLATTLSGCVGTRLNSGLQDLVGKDIFMAAAELGDPDGERDIMGHKVYIWSTNRSAVLFLPTSQTTTGTFGGTPYTATTTGMGAFPAQFSCTIKLTATKDGQITSWEWEGNPGGCSRYARALHRS